MVASAAWRLASSIPTCMSLISSDLYMGHGNRVLDSRLPLPKLEDWITIRLLVPCGMVIFLLDWSDVRSGLVSLPPSSFWRDRSNALGFSASIPEIASKCLLPSYCSLFKFGFLLHSNWEDKFSFVGLLPSLAPQANFFLPDVWFYRQFSLFQLVSTATDLKGWRCDTLLPSSSSLPANRGKSPPLLQHSVLLITGPPFSGLLKYSGVVHWIVV